MKGHNGKDKITDAVEAQLIAAAEELKAMPVPENGTNGKPKPSTADHLKEALKISEQIIERSKNTLIEPEPIIKNGEDGIIFKYSINMVQGKYGSHKSRLLEAIIILALSKDRTELSGLTNNIQNMGSLAVLHVDTERDHRYQLPIAIQNIKQNLGFELIDNVPDYHFLSMVTIPRNQRYQVLDQYVKQVKEKTSKHLLIMLDVVTDVVCDFNKVNESLQLIDDFNSMINTEEVSVCVVAHENPMMEKARGHLGTELGNKSSSVLQIGADDKQKEVIKISFLKTRNTKPQSDLFLEYCGETKNLKLIQPADLLMKQLSENTLEVMEAIGDVLKVGETLTQSELESKIMEVTTLGKTTVKDHLKKIREGVNVSGNYLIRERMEKDGKFKEYEYRLQPI